MINPKCKFYGVFFFYLSPHFCCSEIKKKMLGDYGHNNFVGKISVGIDLFVLCFLKIVHVLTNQYFNQ